jgi:hypothetical protein
VWRAAVGSGGKYVAAVPLAPSAARSNGDSGWWMRARAGTSVRARACEAGAPTEQRGGQPGAAAPPARSSTDAAALGAAACGRSSPLEAELGRPLGVPEPTASGAVSAAGARGAAGWDCANELWPPAETLHASLELHHQTRVGWEYTRGTRREPRAHARAQCVCACVGARAQAQCVCECACSCAVCVWVCARSVCGCACARVWVCGPFHAEGYVRLPAQRHRPQRWRGRQSLRVRRLLRCSPQYPVLD